MRFKCAWCFKSIKPDQPIFRVGARVMKGVDLSKEEGKITTIYFLTRKRSVPALIPLPGSKAKNEGDDIIFPVCSESCGNNMKKSINEEVNLRETH